MHVLPGCQLQEELAQTGAFLGVMFPELDFEPFHTCVFPILQLLVEVGLVGRQRVGG